MKRIGFVDLGSNSVRFVVYEIEDTKSYKLIYQQKESIRLSEGLYENNILTPEAIDRAIRSLKAFSKMVTIMNVHRTISVATAAVRQAKNGKEFVKRVKEETGFSIRVISGEEEAYLGYVGVTNTMNLDNFILFDLGGASVEVTLVKDRMIAESHSFPIGALTLKEGFQKGKELTEGEKEKIVAHITSLFDGEEWLKNLKLPIIGIGGTIRNIAKIDQRAKNYPLPKLHNYSIPLEDFKRIYDELSSLSLSQRKKVNGLSADRSDIIVTGTLIIEQLIKYTKATGLYVSGSGLREGLFFDYFGKHYKEGRVIVENVLSHSAENFFNNLHMCDDEHIQYVKRISNTLFTQWFPLHGCGKRYLELLEVSALLHDAGKLVNYYSHARHSAYIILNASLYGLSHKEQLMASLIGGWSAGNNANLPIQEAATHLLTKKEWEDTKRIALILAVAEMLDESHEQGVRFVETIIEEKKVTLKLFVTPGMNTEIYSVLFDKIQKNFKKSYCRNLEFTIHPLEEI